MGEQASRSWLFFLILVVLGTCMLSATVSAQLNATFVGLGSGEDIYSRYYSRNVPAKVFRMNVNGTVYEGFCIDLFSTISVGNTLLVNGPLDEDIRDDVNWCAVNYIINTYPPVNNLEAASIQAALWYLVTEPYGVWDGSGKYQFMSDPTSPTPYDAYRTSNPRDLVRIRAFEMINASLNNGTGCTFLYPVRVELTPVTANISPLGSQIITAKVFDQNGNPLPGITVNFVNNGPGTGSLSVPSNTTVADGTTTVIFNAGGGTDHVHIDAWVGGNYGTFLYDPGQNKQSVTTLSLLPYSITNRSSIFWTASPSLRLDKLISTDNQTFVHANESPGIPVFVGQNVWYKLVITNDGNVTLGSIQLSDSRYTTCPPPSQLEPGQTFECDLGPFAVTSAGITCNSATANGTYLSTLVQDNDDACYNASATFTKSGTVFIDRNGNGTPDPGEGVEGVLIWVCTLCDQTFPASTVNITRTNVSGYYEVLHLPPGDYNVTVPRFTDDTADVNEELFSLYTPFTNTTIRYITSPIEGVVRSFSVGPNSTGNNFPFLPYGNISGYKLRSPLRTPGTNGTIPLGEWNISLINQSSGLTVASATTNLTGSYSFKNVSPGTYWVNETLLPGWIQTYPSTGSGYSITIPSGGKYNFTTINFSNFQTLGNISGIKYYDGNRDGNYDLDYESIHSEIGLPGWTITLNNSTGFTWTTTTGASGNYSFHGINASEVYTVTEQVLPGWENTTPRSVIVDFTNLTQCPGLFHLYSDADLIARMPDSQIFFVPESRNPNFNNGDYELDIHTVFSGFSVKSQSQFPWVNGAIYNFTVTYDPALNLITYTVKNQTYSSTISWNAGAVRMPVNAFAVRSRSGVANSRIDVFNLTFTPDGGSPVSFPDSGLGGANTSWANLSAGRDLDILFVRAGYITGIPNLTATGYTLTGDQRMSWTGAPPNRSSLAYTIKFGYPNCPLDGDRFVSFGNWQFNTISGYKLEFPSNTPLPSWNISLLAENGTLVKNITTDGTGSFRFENITFGNYTVNETLQTGYSVVSPPGGNYSITVNATNPSHINLNFSNRRDEFGNISGYKRNSTNNQGIPGFIINLTNVTIGTPNYTTMTNATGFYNFTTIPRGVYWLNETNRTGFRAEPPSSWSRLVEINSTTPELFNQNFTNKPLGLIEGYKRNGSASGNPGLSGWTIILEFRPNGTPVATTITNATGYFNFTNLEWGDYQLNETLQPGYVNDTNIPASVPSINVNNLIRRNQNITNQLPGLIEGYKKNETGAGLSGWTILLVNRGNPNPGVTIATATTDANGYYNFTNVTNRNYYVNETIQPCYYNVTAFSVNATINAANPKRVINFTNQRNTASVNITKIPDTSGPVYAGQLVTYTIRVCNTGNLTLDNVQVADNLTGSYTIQGPLAKGDCNTTIRTYSVTEQDICNGSVTNFATVNATDPCGRGVVSDPNATVTLEADDSASMNIIKTANVTGSVYPGQVIGYNITVCNTGNLTLRNIIVGDSLFGNLTVGNGTLAKGACQSVLPNYTVTEQDVCRGWINNTAFANATDPCGGPVVTDPNVSVSLPVDYNASVTITKTASTTGPVGINDIITYNITVCNTGNMTLDVQVMDNRTGNYLIPGLLKGQCNSTLRTYSVTGGDICNGSIVNVASANGTDTCGNSVVTRPNATVTIPTRPSGNISGLKFNDLNGNGIKEINDNPLPGWTINLYHAGNGTFITSAITNATGQYQFQNLPCGLYRVNETQNASWNQTAPPGGNYTVQMNGTSLNVTGRDFGNQEKPSKCSCPTRAYWSFAQVLPNSNHAIQFTDKSTGSPVEWNWSFGDGTYSNLKSPLHTYPRAGKFKVVESVKVCGCTGQVFWTSYTKTITVK